jgi:hypothetical protein
MGKPKSTAGVVELKLDSQDIQAHQVIVTSIRISRRAWWTRRRLRIAAHRDRIQKMLTRTKHVRRSRGIRRAVWCVQLRQKFPSLSAAARFVQCRANSIARAIARGGRCGGYRWELYND